MTVLDAERADTDPRSLHTLPMRPRSKSLSHIDVRKSPPYSAAALEPAQDRSPPFENGPRCACGRFPPGSAHEQQQTLDAETQVSYLEIPAAVKQDEAQVNVEMLEQDDSWINLEAQVQDEAVISYDVHEQSSSPSSTEDENDSSAEEQEAQFDKIGDYAEDEITWSTETSEAEEDDSDQTEPTEDWSLLSQENQSSPQPSHSPAHPPLSSPTNATLTHLPFTLQKILHHHISSPKILQHMSKTTPIFLHSTLQLPCTLSSILNLRLPSLLRRLTPTILLSHTTLVNPRTLLPSLVETTSTSTYTHVEGLLFFPSAEISEHIELIEAFYLQQARCGKMKVVVQIQDEEGHRLEVGAWAWVAEGEGTEEWWTLGQFIARTVVGLEGVEWY